jgi:hypothetical protein
MNGPYRVAEWVDNAMRFSIMVVAMVSSGMMISSMQNNRTVANIQQQIQDQGRNIQALVLDLKSLKDPKVENVLEKYMRK